MCTQNIHRTLRVDRIMVSQEEMSKVDRFTGYDTSSTGVNRQIRPTAVPEFEVTIVFLDGETETYMAAIIANRLPTSGGVAFSEAVAIANVYIEGTEWLMLITANGELSVSDMLVDYSGEPEDLFRNTHVFETE